MSKETRLLIVIISSPIKVQEVVFDDITTFLLYSVVVDMPVSV